LIEVQVPINIEENQRRRQLLLTEAQLEKVGFGAPPRSRKSRSENYDGHQPLEYSGLEAVAWHLATPKSLREFKSDSDLARHFHVARITIHRTKKDIDVIKRAHWLSMRNKLAGDLILRCEYPSIIEKVVELAKKGNIKAMDFCADPAFPSYQKLSQSLNVEELLLMHGENEIIFPTDSESGRT
jgi:hypothetical protein